VEVSGDEEGILARRTIFSPTSRRAFVATDPLNYGMARMLKTYHQMLPNPSQIEVFHDLASALHGGRDADRGLV